MSLYLASAEERNERPAKAYAGSEQCETSK